MLYVFYVDIGQMLTFDMHIAVSSVEKLKENIEKIHHIPAKNIVLLVSGGEMLTHATQVSCYAAGTDTNPIYMFLTGDDRPLPTLPMIEPDAELCQKVDESQYFPVNMDTVRRRALLAQLIFEIAREDERLCEKHVHEQHMQQQGWSSVVANLEDLLNEFKRRLANFVLIFEQHLSFHDKYLDLLTNFNRDLAILARIPILPGLMSLAAADFHGFDDVFDTEAEKAFAQSRMQQESVLKAITETANEIQAANAKASSYSSAIVDTECERSSSDNKMGMTSTSSTSPNKKQKMGDDNDDDEESMVDNETAATDATTAEAATTVATSTSTTTTTTTSATTRTPAPALASTSATTTTNEQPERASQSSELSGSNRLGLNLLQWITSKENHNTLSEMAKECVLGLQSFDESVFEKLKSEISRILSSVDNPDVREFKGLGDRLCKLEDVKMRIKKMVLEQKELATSIQQNQQRATQIHDNSILPDLCASHQSQLKVMLYNHHRIRELCRCIIKAKEELGRNLHMRLKHIVLMQNTMSEVDNRLLFQHRCLRRIEKHLNIIEQIHRAPRIYVAAVTEVVRRKIFSGEFRIWASKLAEDFDVIHVEEINRRLAFNSNFQGHFLNILFPGLGDMPPAFANDIPLIFDARLPNLTKSDIDVLTQNIPDLASDLKLPDMRSVIQFFVAHSGVHQQERIEELVKQEVAASLSSMDCVSGGGGGGGDKPLQHQRLGELRDGGGGSGACDESETDTETDFEKVTGGEGGATANASTSTTESQITIETIARSTTTEAPLMQCAETLTEENAASIRAEVTRLSNLLSSMSSLALECLATTRSTMSNIRADSVTSRDELLGELQTLHDQWDVLHEQYVNRDHKHDVEVVELKNTIERQEAELQKYKSEIQSLDMKCAALQVHLEEFRGQLERAQFDKDVAVAEAREELIHEHKTELESLRCRFKLMTSMERSPSDTSLEKLERPASSIDQNMIDIVRHDHLMAKQRAELEAEKERAISVALEAERTIWQSKIFPLNSESVMANVSMLRDMLEDKERVLDLLREQERIRTQENYQLKARIEALTNEEGNSWLREKIEYLNRDKCRLEEELNMEKSKRAEMETSVVATTKASAHERVSNISRIISLENCAKNDIVFVVWSIRHWQFMVVQDSSILYFVHSDSLAALNLTIPQYNPELNNWGQIPWPYYAIGRILDKEYCMARKDENRYRVLRGTKFYRIKLAPLNSRLIARRDEEFMSVSTASVIVPTCMTASTSGSSTVSAIVSSASIADTTTEYITFSQTAAVSATDIKTESRDASAIKMDYFETSSASDGGAAAVQFEEEASGAASMEFAGPTETQDEVVKADTTLNPLFNQKIVHLLVTLNSDYGKDLELLNSTLDLLTSRYGIKVVEAAVRSTIVKKKYKFSPRGILSTPSTRTIKDAAASPDYELRYRQPTPQELQLTTQSASSVITEQPTASNLLLNVDNVQMERHKRWEEEKIQIEAFEELLQMKEQERIDMLAVQDELEELKEQMRREEEKKNEEELEVRLQMVELEQHDMFTIQEELDEIKEQLRLEEKIGKRQRRLEKRQKRSHESTYHGFCDDPDFGQHMREQYNSSAIYTTPHKHDAFNETSSSTTTSNLYSSESEEEKEEEKLTDVTLTSSTTEAAIVVASSTAEVAAPAAEVAPETTAGKTTTTAEETTTSGEATTAGEVETAEKAAPATTAVEATTIEEAAPATTAGETVPATTSIEAAPATTTVEAAPATTEVEATTPREAAPALARVALTKEEPSTSTASSYWNYIAPFFGGVPTTTAETAFMRIDSHLPQSTEESMNTSTTDSVDGAAAVAAAAASSSHTSKTCETTLVGTFSEDSDDYRSLEGKDELE